MSSLKVKVSKNGSGSQRVELAARSAAYRKVLEKSYETRRDYERMRHAMFLELRNWSKVNADPDVQRAWEDADNAAIERRIFEFELGMWGGNSAYEVDV